MAYIQKLYKKVTRFVNRWDLKPPNKIKNLFAENFLDLLAC